MLYHPNFNHPFIIQCDASMSGLGGCLYQQYGDEKRVIHYVSRSLRGAEKSYTVNELECLAILWCIHKFRIYLLGRRFTVITDHKNLQWLHRSKNWNSRLTRWSVQLQDYSFDVQYCRGSENTVADSLSRYYEKGPETSLRINSIEGKTSLCEVEKSELIRLQREDSHWSPTRTPATT